MRRGDLVTVAASGDYGKPRPAVIVQTDAFPENHASVVVCQLTSELADAPDFRVTIEPKPENGLRFKSQVMADKPVTVRRERIGQKTGVSATKTWLGSELPWPLFWGSRIRMLRAQATASKNHMRLSADRCGIFRCPATISCKIVHWRP